MLEEVLGFLQVRPGGRFVDATSGEGGHAEAMLLACAPGGGVLSLDVDHEAVRLARERLRGFGPRVTVVRASNHRLKAIASRYGYLGVDGVLLDLGLSSLQLEGVGRGFSFRRDEPLDLRFDLRRQLTGAEVINTYPAEELERIIRDYGEERRARRVVRAIVDRRPILWASQLARVVEEVVGRFRGRVHPATRVFQALRIYVNRELDNLAQVLPQAVSLLMPGGRLVAISYHSLEDRMVKQFFKNRKDSIRVVVRKVIRPSREEIISNPRSRSAKLRVGERLAV